MNFKLLVGCVALASAVALSGCDKLGLGGSKEAEEKASEAKKAEEAAKLTADAAKKGEEEAKKTAEDALKKEAEAKKAAEDAAAKAATDTAKAEEAKKAAEEAAKKAEEDRLKAEEEKKKAEEEKAAAEEAAKRDALIKDLTDVSAKLAQLKADLTTSSVAWANSGEKLKADELIALLKEVEGLYNEPGVVQGLLAQSKLDEARTKIDVLRAKLQPISDKAAPMVNEKPVDPAMFEKMLNLLAEETCLIKKNAPTQEFQTAREALFAKYAMDRVIYEQLRARYNQNPKPEDQAKLGQLVGQFCPEPAAPEQPKGEQPTGEEGKLQPTPIGGKTEPGKEEVKTEEAKPGEADGVYKGAIKGKGKKTGKIEFTVKNGKLSGATVQFDNVVYSMQGAFGNHLALVGKSKNGADHMRCNGTVKGKSVKGQCLGTIKKDKYEGLFEATR